MPVFYNFIENGINYSFDDVFVPADLFRDGNLWTWGLGSNGRLGNAQTVGNISTPVTTFAGGTNWKQVSAGNDFMPAIKTDGTLWTWGVGGGGRLGNAQITNRSTPVTTFAGETNWKQVSCGFSHTAAIKTDGTLWTWGFGSNGVLGNATISASNISTPVTTFAGGTNWKQVSSGGSHTAAIKTDGTLWTWGFASNGALGNGVTTGSRSTPVTTFAGGTNWKQVNCGGYHTAAIKTDGTLWTWGFNGSGQLGRTSDFARILTPVTTFTGGTNWADVATTEPEDLYTLSAGNNHTSAIKTDGTLWTWGSGGDGQLGDNTVTGRSTPVTTFAGGTNWKQVNSGISYMAAIKTDGTLWTWGRGPLGNNFSESTNRPTPVTTFAGGTNWKQVSCALSDGVVGGRTHVAAIKTDGTLWLWGRGPYGQLGINNALLATARLTPVTTFAGGTNWKQVSTGNLCTAAIKTDGTLWTWGYGLTGRLGNGSFSNQLTPITTFAGGTNWKQVACGGLLIGSHTAAIKTDGTLWTWGYVGNGRLGNGAITGNISTPITTFAGGTNWKQVSCGGYHTAAIKTDGTLWTWGFNSSGQLGDNTATNRSTPVTTFAGGTNWKQVSCGGYHTIALNDDGVNKRLYVWGDNRNSRLGTNWFSLDILPSQTFAGGTNWKQVDVGRYHTGAIKTDGTLWTWGYNFSGQLGNNTTTYPSSTPVTTFAGGTNWKQVSAGFFNTTAIKSVDFSPF
jgi:alpha-tubulin suppressor-like RCC1 family protein